MNYKSEIDGLRALAVMLVLLCHMQLGLPGGYIGVDIFFVISGFLITGTIMSGIEQNKFSFWRFYGKRFIRLYPALIATIALTFIAGFLLLDPFLMGWLARSGKYAATSTSNLFYNDHLGYFDLGAQSQVFLHTWSLGVEWQFYLLCPALLWLALKVSRKLVFILFLLITIASVFLSQWMITHGQATAAYYLMPSRTFEIGLGALLVFFYDRRIGPRTGAFLVFAGLACVLIASFIFNPESQFPGFNALLPCLGVTACIFGGKAFSTGNILRFSAVVFIGKISYSVYLVHWPLVVLYKYYVFRELYLIEKISLALSTLILGTLLYWLVEKRISWGQLKHKLGVSLIMLALIGIFVGVFEYSNRPSGGLAWRIAKDNPINKAHYYKWGIGSFPQLEITLGQVQNPLAAVVAGDSFAANMSIGLNDYANKTNHRIERFYEPGCLISILEQDAYPITPACKVLSQHAITFTQQHPGIPLILIQAWGGQGLKENPEKQEQYNQLLISNLDNLRINLPGHPIFVVGSPLYRQWGTGEKECLRRPPYLPQVCQKQIPDYPASQAFAYQTNIALQQYAQQHDQVYYIDLKPVNCPQGTCYALDNAKLYYDGFHASEFGAQLMVQYIMQEVNRLLHQDLKSSNSQ